ncbi:DMT family transporter [Gulosibacter chungangensis]|nr:DMT family transporter [Gulosibacter chungangensis]
MRSRRISTWAGVVVAVLIGVGAAGQSHINGALAQSLGSGPHAAVISFGTALAVSLLVVAGNRAARQGVRRVLESFRTGQLPLWGFLGGLLGAQMVFAQTYLVPVVGVAVFMTSRMVGQLIGSMSIDHFGWLGSPVRRLTRTRSIGAALAVAAVMVIASGSDVEIQWVGYLLAGAVAGFLVSLQMGVTGAIKLHARNSFSATLLNFAVGTSALLTVMLVGMSLGWVHAGPLPVEPWKYLGGVLGALYVVLIAAIVRTLGVTLLSLSIVGGQLLGSLIFDTIVGRFSWLLVAGLCLAFIGIGLANMPTRR